MQDFPVIGIVGLQASGKTEVAERMSEADAGRVRMGDIVWTEARKRGLEVNEKVVGRLANELREKEGMEAIAKRCISQIKDKGGKKGAVVVDGIRGIAEVKEFKENFGEDFFLISVKAPEDSRYRRIIERKREDDIDDIESFKEKEERELKWGLREAMESADYLIENKSTLEKLREKASKTLKEIKKDYEG